jgi:N-acetyl-anhydromuramyl-L-alanine amidase AmpD
VTTKDQVARIIVSEAKKRGHTRDECLAEMSCLYQESGWNDTVWDPTHTTYGVAQQDGSYPNRFNGAAAQVSAFFDRLDVKRTSPGHGDIWLNLCWLQQAPNWPSAQYWYDHGRRGYLAEIESRISTVTPYLDKYWPAGEPVTALDPSRPDFNEYWVESPSSQDRGGTKVDLWLIHTQEGAGNADSLAQFLANPSNGVSYHYTVSEDPDDHGVTVCDVVDTDLASWSVLSANDRSINLCFAGSSVKWSRAQWLQQSRAINVAAYLCVQDCLKYGIAPNVILPPYRSDPPGISDHRYVTDHLGDGTHTDVGPNFPWDVFRDAINKYWQLATATATAPAPAPVPTPAPAPAEFEYPPQDEMVKQIWEQMFGPQAQGWPDLFGKTADGRRGKFTVEAIADLHKATANG